MLLGLWIIHDQKACVSLNYALQIKFDSNLIQTFLKISFCRSLADRLIAKINSGLLTSESIRLSLNLSMKRRAIQ